MSDTTSSNSSTNSESEAAIEDAEVVAEAPESDEPVVVELSEDEIDAPEEAIESANAEAERQPSTLKPLLGLVGGGVLAAGIGFVATVLWWPQASEADASQLAELQATLTSQQEAIDQLNEADGGLSAAITQVEAQIAPQADLSGIQAELETLQASLRRIETRVDALETRPLAGVNPDGAEALQAQLQAFREELDRATAEADARVEAALAEASEVEATAAGAALAADRGAALAELKVALDTGASLEGPLARLEVVPAALEAATDGVPTLARLQDEFPEAARQVLAATSVAPENASTTERLTSFLKRHTNARSLAPKEGDDPDAILSRAEALLSGGDLNGAITELQALPEPAQAVMADWLNLAGSRAAALAAYAEIAATN